MLTAKEIRESFKQFFASKEHQIVPSAPMVVKGDPTLMFTNAGMNQFKDIILGNVPRKYPRVADSQKCLRVSGKHNDLEEVGHDTYHHTMFEMLGNWSFGDYFKKEAINWAWEYLVEVLKLNPERLYATVFEGSPAEGLDRDNEAAGYWEQYLPKDHILNGNKHDNFWEMGDTGPCGPCSEIHIDLRSDEERAAVSGADMVNKDHPQVIEIWNLVFMQFNRKADGSLEPLPAKVIDTGMGFERLCMALQGKTSNYDTDVFQPIIKVIAGMAGTTYGTDKQQDIAMRVIADHIRTIAFAITDGQLPSNAKAGYVIRRILRRAVRYGYTFLDRKEAFMYKLLPVLIETMGDAYPELIAQKTLIEKVIKEEEESFLRTLETGIRLLDKKMEETKAAGKTVLNGVDAFTLYDTYGFPLDLTELILRENGMEADIEAFNKAMQKQKERARNAAAIETGDWITLKEGECKFVGYDLFECEAEILRYRQIKQKNKVLYQIVLDQTPFYAEMGGQVGDTGWLIADDEKIDVIDTKRENNLPVHLVAKLPKDVTATFTAKINEKKRIQCECNHSATHLLHEALREVLGTHVEQKGSYVSPDSLRFDFSHFQKVTDEEIRKVEILVGEKIRANFPLEEHRNMPIAEAKALGAMALFGEKYGDIVRVVNMGDYSIEFCGGTHVANTSEIGAFKILSESGVAAGVRRIEALTSKGLMDYYGELEQLLHEAAKLLKATPDTVSEKIAHLQAENKELHSEVESLKSKLAKDAMGDVMDQVEEVAGVKVIAVSVEDMDMNGLRDLGDQLKEKIGEGVVVIASSANGKVSLMATATDEAMKKGAHAGNLIKAIASCVGGGGGGRPNMAQAGGKNPAGIPDALAKVKEVLAEQIK